MSELQNRPLVSVITIFFNAERFFEEAIQSVLAQTYDHWELLLVDDGSTDGGTEIARRYAARFPEKIRYLEHAGHVNRGMSATRNLGIRHARGEFIALLDADDVFLPQKLEQQLAIFESHPRAAMVFGPTLYWQSWTGDPADRARDHVPELGVETDTLFEPPSLLTRLYPLGPAPAPCLCGMLLRTHVVRNLGGFEEAFTGYYEDQAFLTKLYLSNPVFVTQGCWDRYRIHGSSCSAAVEQAGEYDSYRKQFLEWFRSYLHEQRVTDTRVWAAVDEAAGNFEPAAFPVCPTAPGVQESPTLPASSPVAPRFRESHDDPPGGEEPVWEWLRLLRVAEGNSAQLEFPLRDSNTVRIAITSVVSPETYDIQLNHPRLRACRGETYRVRFQARADQPRRVGVGFSRSQSPWTNLGLYAQIDLTPQWQWFEQEFCVSEDEDNARIHFDVGGSNVPVEFSSLTVHNLTHDLPVTPSPLSGNSSIIKGQRRPLEPAVPVGEVQFGSLRRLTPISRDFGCDRGRAIDRYYIENFLARSAEHVRGRVLEIGENVYTRRFGGERVEVSDILHVVPGTPQATIIADLASADHIPSNSFDCIILTQTLQLIYDVKAAVRTLHRILKPGGSLLATFPGISQSYDYEWGEHWCWNFTAVSARKLFGEVFGDQQVQVEAHGNVLAAISFLHGLAEEELTHEELDYREPGYDVTIAVRAVKAAQPSTAHAGAASAGAGGRQSGSSTAQAAILMYHSVADGQLDPWGLCVSPQHFAAQLQWLRQHVRPISLGQFLFGFENGNIPPGSVIVTFDDGYADNLHSALPALEQFEIPATVFISTGFIGDSREFWWDELARLLLTPRRLPESLQLTVRGTAYRWSLRDDALPGWTTSRAGDGWKAWEDPPSARHALYRSLWQLIQPLTADQQRAVLDELQAWAPAEDSPVHRSLTRDELVALASSPRIEIGAHTVSHPLLATLTLDAQTEEIRRSRQELEALLRRPVTSFTYPYGNYTAETPAVVRELGLSCACSTVEAVVQRNADRFQLPRLQVGDWDVAEFAQRFEQWFAT